MQANKKARRLHDYYPTPDKLAQHIVDGATAHLPSTAAILEPSAGTGSFLRALELAGHGWRYVTALEPYQACAGAIPIKLEDFKPSCEYDLIIGNPPYTLAEDHVRRCLGMLTADGELVFLLRLGFLGSLKRIGLYEEHPPETVEVLQGRPSYTGDGKTDGHEYAVFTWVSKPSRRTRLTWSTWK